MSRGRVDADFGQDQRHGRRGVLSAGGGGGGSSAVRPGHVGQPGGCPPAERAGATTRSCPASASIVIVCPAPGVPGRALPRPGARRRSSPPSSTVAGAGRSDRPGPSRRRHRRQPVGVMDPAVVERTCSVVTAAGGRVSGGGGGSGVVPLTPFDSPEMLPPGPWSGARSARSSPARGPTRASTAGARRERRRRTGQRRPCEARRRDRLGGIAGRRRRRGRPGHPRGTPGQGDAGLVDRRYGQVGHGGRRRVSGGGGGAAVAACATFDGGALLPASSTVFSEVVVVPAVVLTTCDCGARRRGGRLARHGLREREVRCADGAGGITQVVACGRARGPVVAWAVSRASRSSRWIEAYQVVTTAGETCRADQRRTRDHVRQCRTLPARRSPSARVVVFGCRPPAVIDCAAPALPGVGSRSRRGGGEVRGGDAVVE